MSTGFTWLSKAHLGNNSHFHSLILFAVFHIGKSFFSLWALYKLSAHSLASLLIFLGKKGRKRIPNLLGYFLQCCNSIFFFPGQDRSMHSPSKKGLRINLTFGWRLWAYIPKGIWILNECWQPRAQNLLLIVLTHSLRNYPDWLML